MPKDVTGHKTIDWETDDKGSVILTESHWSKPWTNEPGKWIPDKEITLSKSEDGKWLDIDLGLEGNCFFGRVSFPIERIEELLKRGRG